MEPVDACYEHGVLRLTKPLHLRPGEKVQLIVIRRSDPKRWDLDRLARTGATEDRDFAEVGLAGWADGLDREDGR